MATRPLTKRFVEIRNASKSNRALSGKGGHNSRDDHKDDVPILVRM